MNLSGSRFYFIGLFASTIITIWLVNDFVLNKAKSFSIYGTYTLIDKTVEDIFEKLLRERITIENSSDPRKVIIAYIHTLECNYFLLYSKYISLKSYYDSIIISLYPPQRLKTRGKLIYTQQAKKFLRKNRRLEIMSLGYEYSSPIFYGIHMENAKIYVNRITPKGKQKVCYYFRKYGDWFYLLVKSPHADLNFRLINSYQNKTPSDKNE